MKNFRARLTYANVVSSIALFFALGIGGAWAATELSKNSVKSKHIAKGQVKRSDIAKNAVNSSKVAEGSLLGSDFAAGQLPAGEKGDQGETGPTLGVTEAETPVPPPAESINGGVSITTPVAGKLFVSGDVDLGTGIAISVDCTPNAVPTIGMYVDDIPIKGTQRTFADAVTETYHATGVTETLPAGTHVVRLGASCAGASSPALFSLGIDRSLSAILLGS